MNRGLFTLGMLLAAVAIGRAIQFGNGGFDPMGILWLRAALCLGVVGLVLPALPAVDATASMAMPFLCLAALTLQFGLLLSSSPGVYLQWQGADTFTPYHYGMAAAGVVAGLGLAQGATFRKIQLPLLIAIYFVLGGWMIRTSPQPFIDVYYIHRDSIRALLHGSNPYQLTFPNIYRDDSFFGPGMVQNGRLMFGYTYMPLCLLASVPGQVLGGDYRYSLLAAMGASAWFIGKSSPGPWGPAAAALFLFTPRSLFVLEQGWTEPYVLLCLTGVVFCACRAPRVLPWMLGLLLAVKQYTFLFFPPALLLPQLRMGLRPLARIVFKALGFAALITGPFCLWNPRAFFYDVFAVQLKMPFRLDALTFTSGWVQAGGHRPPDWLGFVAVAVIGLLLYLRAPRTPAGFAASCAMVFLFFVAFGRQAFCNYYYLILGAMLSAVGAAHASVPTPPKALPAAMALALALTLSCRTPAALPGSMAAPLEVVFMRASFPAGSRGEFDLGMRIQNPEEASVSVDSIQWEVWLNGIYFAAGIQAVPQTIAARAERLVEFKLPVALRQMNVVHGPVSLQMLARGKVLVRQGAGDLRQLPFSATRKITANGAPVLTGNAEDDR